MSEAEVIFALPMMSSGNHVNVVVVNTNTGVGMFPEENMFGLRTI